jgi:hypothetical protein
VESLPGSNQDRRRRTKRPSRGAAPCPPSPVAEWSRPAPICEYRLVRPGSALLHVERKVRDRPGFVLALGTWLEEHNLHAEEFVYSPYPGGFADVEVVAAGTEPDVVRALQAACGPGSPFEAEAPNVSVPEKRHTARCTLYIPHDILVENILIPVGKAAFQPGAVVCPGLPYANISYLCVERSPYALGVPGCMVDVFLTTDSSEVLDAALARLDSIREPLGSADAWIFRTWPCACPVCAEGR